jgi:hypothetical protein
MECIAFCYLVPYCGCISLQTDISLRILLHETKSYVLRAPLASTLNKNTHREGERE